MKDKKKSQKQPKCDAEAGASHEFNGTEFTKKCLHDEGHPGDHLFVWKRVQ